MVRVLFRIILVWAFVCSNPGAAWALDFSNAEEATILLLAARNAVQAGAREKAAIRYQKLIEKFPEVVEGHREYGWLLIQEGNYHAGLKHLRQWGTMISDKIGPRIQLIEALMVARRFSQVRKELRSFLASHPGHEQGRLLQARYHQARRRLSEAQAIYESLLGTSLDRECRIGLFEIALIREDLEQAQKDYHVLLKRFGHDLSLQKHYILLSGRLGRIAEAYVALEKLPNPDIQSITEAELRNVTGQFFAAEALFHDRLKQRPRDYSLLMGLGRAYVGQQDESRAATVFEKVLEWYPEDVEARLILAEMLFHQRQWKKGEPIVTELVEEKPVIFEAEYLTHRWKRRTHHPQINMSLPGNVSKIDHPAKALGPQNYLRRFEDWNHMQEISSPLIFHPESPHAFLYRWAQAMVVTGQAQKGLRMLQSLRIPTVKDPVLKTIIAKFQAMLGQQTEAERTLGSLPPSLRQGRLLRQLGKVERASKTFSQLVEADPGNTPVHIELAKVLSQRGLEDMASQVLDNLFKQCPEKGWPALVRLLIHPEGSTSEYRTQLQATLEARGLNRSSLPLDSRMNFASLISQHDKDEAVVQLYDELVHQNPKRPMIQLGYARALAQVRGNQGNHHITPVVRAYDQYLQTKPYDETVWVEKARFLGWVSEYEDAKEEYQAIVKRFPQEEDIRFEQIGKREFWRQHYRAAARSFVQSLEATPGNEEALGDLGHIHSSRVRFVDSQSYYRRLLGVNPGHRLAAESLSLAKVFHRPQITLGVGYVKMDGFDGSLLTKYLPVTGEVFAPLSSDLWLGAGYQWVKIDVPGEPSAANIGRFMVRYSTSPVWHVDGYVAGLTYTGTEHSNVNFGAGVSYEWESGVKGRIETGRQDLWQNAATIEKNISYHSYSVGTEYSVAEDWEISAGAGYWDYSDRNWNVNGQIAGRYTLLPFPHPLRVSYQLDAFGFKRERAYFSPSFFAKNTVALGWQHFLGFPRRQVHHGETPVRHRYSGNDIYAFLGWPTRPQYQPQTALNSYALDYAISLDDDSYVYHQVTASFAYALTRRCHVQVSGMLIRASVVDQDAVNGFMQCHL